MSHIQLLRLFISERLTAAAEEIFEAVERTIAEYEEEATRSQQDSNHQQGLLQVDLKQEVKLHREASSQLFACAEELPLEQEHYQQEWSPKSGYDNPGVGQEHPEPPAIKEEQQEPWSSPGEGEQLPGMEEADPTNFTFTPTCVKSCIYPDLTPFQTHGVENEDRKPLPSTSADQRAADGNSDSSGECQPILPDCSITRSDTEPELGLKTLTDFSISKDLKFHRRTHTGNIPFTKACELELLHIRAPPERKRRDKPYCCRVCGKEFSHSAHLATHTRIHTGGKLFSCQVCGKEFRHGNSVIVHMRIHTQEKPYRCRLCGKEFRHVGNLNVHMRIHTGEKPYSCIVCGKKFSRNNLMTNHMAVHTGEKSLGVKSVGGRGSVHMPP
uniref:uncharacterized protein n=1 Tax=Centroberyx gerrardi TaxID=166262 RepID=UPI003AAC776B